MKLQNTLAFIGTARLFHPLWHFASPFTWLVIKLSSFLHNTYTGSVIHISAIKQSKTNVHNHFWTEILKIPLHNSISIGIWYTICQRTVHWTFHRKWIFRSLKLLFSHNSSPGKLQTVQNGSKMRNWMNYNHFENFWRFCN